jgi:hypothetical protein
VVDVRFDPVTVVPVTNGRTVLTGGGWVAGGFHGSCGMVGTDEKTIGGGVWPGVDGNGGGIAPTLNTLANTIGGAGGVVVKLGNRLAGTVALPGGTNCGCGTPGLEGGTGAGPTAGPTSGPRGTATGAVFGETGGKTGKPTGSPIVGGGMIGVPVMGPAAGTVALPLPNTGCGMPAIEGGTGAGWIGGVPLLIRCTPA